MYMGMWLRSVIRRIRMTRKILYSPGYGAGWTTWNNGEVAKYMLTYQPIIDFLEAGNKFTYDECEHLGSKGKIHPLLTQLQKECLEKFGEDYVCILGADNLEVAEVTGRVKINEYDGFESFDREGDDEGWM